VKCLLNQDFHAKNNTLILGTATVTTVSCHAELVKPWFSLRPLLMYGYVGVINHECLGDTLHPDLNKWFSSLCGCWSLWLNKILRSWHNYC
jgi:hypothetical protein